MGFSSFLCGQGVRVWMGNIEGVSGYLEVHFQVPVFGVEKK